MKTNQFLESLVYGVSLERPVCDQMKESLILDLQTFLIPYHISQKIGAYPSTTSVYLFMCMCTNLCQCII